MEDLIINYNRIPKGLRITYILFAICMLAVGITLCVKDNAYDFVFYMHLLYAICGAVMILKNTVWQPAPTLQITNSIIETKKIKVDWTAVSKVNIGLAYIIFLTNGEQKQQKLDLSDLLYKDIKSVKSKILELCEQKNIPYHND
ncbi:MAG: hypothetical protein LBL79_11915 [Prevotella sp.]|jgi:hypothetical protein|nr:hypothetical protein [Prevotella sp.]